MVYILKNYCDLEELLENQLIFLFCCLVDNYYKFVFCKVFDVNDVDFFIWFEVISDYILVIFVELIKMISWVSIGF